MKMIGRKLYLAWGDNTVVAIEKLSISPEAFGMKKPSEIEIGDKEGEDYACLADVMDVFGERQELNLRPPVNPSHAGATIDRFFCDQGNWIDEKDAAFLEKNNVDI